MMTNRTFTMIKPDAVAAGHIGAILHQITEAGFKIVALKLTRLTADAAGRFYEVHQARPFYGELVQFMSSGPIVAAILEKENAVEDFRTLIGATDPSKAAPGTIRAKYAKNVGENAVHGSDSNENAAIESAFHFAGVETFA
jgi:nucleoside-diphosphate kinase